MLIETDDSIKQYYELVKHKFPNMSYIQFQEICKNPFKFFKLKIETPEMPTIHIKYFGKLTVFSATIKRLLKELEVKKKYISIERYERYKINLQARLKTIQEHEDNTSNKGTDTRKETTD